ncbi:MAG: hypothetical protein MUF31_02395 [Akkermansiaceae bacterium]|nr:hypothetical protein [Akkermansiaceae bacterium]
MADPREEKDVKLKVVEEDPSSTEEVLRLDGDDVIPVARLQLPPAPERASKLDSAKAEYHRRSHEPGVEKLIEEFVEKADPEVEWKEADQRKVVPYGWFVLILLLVSGAVIAGLWWGQEREEEVAEVREVVRQRVEGDEASEAEALDLVETIERGLRDYTLAHDVEAKLRHVRDPERVAPLMMDWYARHDPGTPDFVRMGGMAPVVLGDQEFWQVVYENELERSRKVLMVVEDGVAKVDWETDVCYQPLEWDDYAKRLPEGAGVDFRLLCAPDSLALYSHEFQNEEMWRAYQLGTRQGTEFLIGYVRRDGEIDRRLLAIYQANGGKAASVILTLRRPTGARSPRGVVIEKIVSENWVIVGGETK